MNTSVISYRPGYNHSLEIIMTKTKFVEIKSANVSGIFEVVANKGVCWQLKGSDGELFMAQKRQVVRGPWEEEELTVEEEAAELAANHNPTFAAALAQVQVEPAPAAKASRKKPAEPAEDAEPQVTLKELCFDLNVVPRIARRRLRKALGNIGTGSRWEWALGSQDLEKVKQVLLAKTEAAPDADADANDAE